MDQDIMEVSYSDNVVTTQLISVDLQHDLTSTINPSHDENVQTILYTQDGQSMTELQKSTEEHPSTTSTTTTTITTNNNNNSNITDVGSSINNNNNNNQEEQQDDEDVKPNIIEISNGSSKSMTRFKWTKEKSQVAMNLVKYGCKPKLVSVAVGCSLRTAQKFVETVTPKIEGESYNNYVIRRRGRKSKDVNDRLEAIREVLSKDSTKTQVAIAADLKVSNTTVCRDIKRIRGSSWKEKRSNNELTPTKHGNKNQRSQRVHVKNNS